MAASASSALDLRHGSATHCGRVRRYNEDSCLAAPPVFVVADGMGGHRAGDLASAIVVEEFADLGPSVEMSAVRAALHRADGRVRCLAGGAGRAAGTTVAAVVLVRHAGVPFWFVVNVGDSRTYLLTRGALHQVSVDHSLVQEMVDTGRLSRDEARRHPQRHVITRSVGASPVLVPECWLLPVSEHERLLLCSDGLSSEVDDQQLGEVLRGEPDPQRAADRLVEMAVEAGGRDNVTAVVVDVVAVPAATDAEEQTVPRRTMSRVVSMRSRAAQVQQAPAVQGVQA